jgi:glycosyltransferase involved in cell wall biosynthesis
MTTLGRSMQPRVLLLSPQVFPTPHSGVGMRGHFQAVHLSQRWPLTLVTETGVHDVVDGRFTHRTREAATEPPTSRAYLRSVVSGTHYLYEKYGCRRWTLPDIDDFTHVIVHYPALLELLADRPRPRASVLFDTHNNEREYYESVAAQTANPIKRAVIRKQANVSERVITQTSGGLSATISVSESDRNWIAPLCPDGVQHFVIPNNLFRYQPTTWSGRRSILFVGSLNVTMNLQALDWFTTQVWPGVRRVEPDVEFVVAGRDPSRALVAELERNGAKVIPNAPSLAPLYRDAVFSLIPASSGSGGKIKVCEALAHGVPVITTPHGLVGQPKAVRDCCTVRDRPDDWVDAIQAQIRRPRRSTPEWDGQVEAALDSSYFGTSIGQMADFIEATCRVGR